MNISVLLYDSKRSDLRIWLHSATTGVGDGERGHNGGVWEWTSTVFDKHESFKPSTLYPGFSADFFDNLHNVVVCDILSIVLFFELCALTKFISKIGGSYATTPRQAGRRTLRNFFQRDYPYAWNGGRVVYDVAK